MVSSTTSADEPVWRKSSYSMGNGNCMEVAGLPGRLIGARDSKDPDGHKLEFTPAAWQEFITRIKAEVSDGDRP